MAAAPHASEGNTPGEDVPLEEDASTGDLEQGRKLFAGETTFLLGVAHLSQLPSRGLPEVTFAGRSNVGKSSLINALTGRKDLARTSNTPGRTQQINMFDLSGRLTLADLPGYGYAQAPKAQVKGWTNLVMAYLRGRAELRRVCVLIDARHGLKPTDRDVMAMLDTAAQVFQVVLTKCDKVKPAPLDTLREKISKELAGHPAAHPRVIATSSAKMTGIAELRAELASLADPPP